LGDRTIWIILAEVAAIVGLVYLVIRSRDKTLRRLLEEALARAAQLEAELEVTRKRALLEAKEEAMRLRQEAEEEMREKRGQLERLEQRLEGRRERIEEREAAHAGRSQELAVREQEAAARARSVEEAEHRLAGLDAQGAKELVLRRVEAEFRELAQARAREIEAMTTAEAERQARQRILSVMERRTVEYVAEATIAVVNLPSDEMKGRIIGRDGRNIRAFEQVAGVDLIIDDTPEAVVISCFDPVRRETARVALMNLMVDGRIHPGRIEELFESAQAEVQRQIERAGAEAAERAGIAGLPSKVVETMGRLRFRTSYAQNVLDHSVEVAHLAAMLAAELRANVEAARRAGFLHDIGKALGEEHEGPHAVAGMNFLRQCGIREPILNAVGAHHHDIAPESPEASIVIVADSISASRPGSRRESLNVYVKRLAALEDLANSFPGVERSYALQAGREVRLVVRPEQIDDLAAARLASEVARRIEAEMEYPGQIKVTVIRETRASDVAK
jgi:ribonuclease Y